MEYVDGEDLASLLRRIGRLPQDKAIDIARQLCAGLAAAHERGVLHRDLKPANVMIDGDGNVRIADFGLAVAAGDAAASRAGTPQYMAPELLAGGQASVKTDIYALGLVLFEMFTGRRAYEAKTLNELIALQQSGTLSTPSSVVRDLDPAVERVILRCLEHDPALRPEFGARRRGRAAGRRSARGGAGRRRNAVAGDGRRRRRDERLQPLASAFRCWRVRHRRTARRRPCCPIACCSSRRIPLEKSVDALEDRARDIIAPTGIHGAAGRHGARILPAAGLHQLRPADRSVPDALGLARDGGLPVPAFLVPDESRAS